MIRADDVRISEYGFNELVEDELNARVVVGGIAEAEVIEE